MDYAEIFQNLRTNNKYGRKSPDKAVLMLTVIELYEQNVLSENEIYYDDKLKSTFVKVWNRVLPNEPLFHPEAYFPFWYLQSDSFWHIVPVRGKEDILSLMRDTNIKPSEAKLNDCVKYAELDDDLYFLMTLPSGRSSLKRVLLESYTNLSKRQIDQLSESVNNIIDYSASALSDYEKILSNNKNEKKLALEETGDELVQQFQSLNEDIQIVLNLQYYSFLKLHRNEREMFKEICPTVYDLFDKVVNHPIKQGDISPSFAFIYDNFLSDLKIALMSEEGSMELIEKIGESLEALRGNLNNEEKINKIKQDEILAPTKTIALEKDVADNDNDDLHTDIEIEHVYLDKRGNVIRNETSVLDESPNIDLDDRRGKGWTLREEEIITRYFNQGKDLHIIAAIVERTIVAVKSRLAKLGLIDYSYEKEKEASAKSINVEKEKTASSINTVAQSKDSSKGKSRTIKDIDLISYFKSGMTIDQIARYYGVDANVIKERLLQRGIKV